jgi:hypothetical protein
MFVLSTKYDRFIHHVTDVKDLQDILLGLTDDKNESKRIAIIAGNMTFGDGFATSGIMLTCQEDK